MILFVCKAGRRNADAAQQRFYARSSRVTNTESKIEIKMDVSVDWVVLINYQL